MVNSNEEHGFTRCMEDIWLAKTCVCAIFFELHDKDMMAINVIKICAKSP